MKIVSDSLSMMSTAFGLVAALAWNEAIKQLIEQFIPKGQGVLSLFIYAILVTVVTVMMISRLTKIRERFEQEKSI